MVEQRLISKSETKKPLGTDKRQTSTTKGSKPGQAKQVQMNNPTRSERKWSVTANIQRD